MKRAVTALLFGLLASGSTASADTYPSKPITVILPYAAGGSTDAAIRLIIDKMKDFVKGSIIVENKPGAGTTVGAAAAARAPKDGYTLFVITQSTAAIAPHLYAKVDYTLDSFAPISQTTRVPVIAAVKKGLPVTNPKELVEYIKSKQPSYGTPGAGTIAHLLGLMIAQNLKVEFTHVPYRGGGPAVNDLIGGNIDMLFDAIGPTVVSQHEAGLLRVVGVFGESRFEGFPNAATFKESGFPNIVGESYTGIVAPAGTPAAIVSKLNDAIRKALADPDVTRKLLEAGTPAQGSTPEEFGARMTSDYELWGKVAKAAALPKVE
jgi:tripartite-type tricarboxylate transporter receptor subunit TctC